jgi:hypothetical protein
MSEAVFNKLLRDLEAQILGTRQSGRTDRSNLIDSYCLLKLVVDGIDLKGGDLGASAGAYTIIKGVAGDGIADDTIAINTALQQAGQALNSKQVLGTAGKAIVFLPGGTYKISSTITVPTGITLRGETVVPPYPNRLSGFGSNFNMFTGTELVCTSNFVGSVAVDLSADNTSIENIILDGHSIPSGTCYTIIRATTAQNKRVDTGYLKFGVTDLSDFRQPKSIEIDTWEIPFFEVNKYFEYQFWYNKFSNLEHTKWYFTYWFNFILFRFVIWNCNSKSK